MRLTSPVVPAVSRSVAIQATSLVKSFVTGQDVVRAVRDISLEVRKGEVVTLEGPSGSGKTTLLCIIGCMLTPDSGRLIVDGREVDPRRPERLPEFRRSSIGFVFQQFNLFPALTARENILYALKIKGVTGKPARREADRMIEAVGLTARQRARPRELSGGQKQRVAIARAMAGPATILLADEPTANLDASTGVQILDMFRELARKENRAVVIVTHDPKVRRIADRVCTIHDGQLSELEPEPEVEAEEPISTSLVPIARLGMATNGHHGSPAFVGSPIVEAMKTWTSVRPDALPTLPSVAALPEEVVIESPAIELPKAVPPPPKPQPLASIPLSAVPHPWASEDVGSSDIKGSASQAEGRFLLVGGGTGLGSQNDAFHFVDRMHKGDGALSARIDAAEGGSGGLMVRASSEPNAPYIALMVTPGHGVSLHWRTKRGGAASQSPVQDIQGRVDLRLVRQETTFTGYVSTEAGQETLIGTTTVPLRSHVFLGLVASSIDGSNPACVTFDAIGLT